ncbi:MAG TPA: heparinase II/III family protein [Rhizomicrobium sp.]|nr:heparinase II/III family protein [Rhizomicrobium sp.]
MAARARFATFSLLPEMLSVAWRRAMRGPRVLWRGSWFYRRLLKGPLADRVVFHPYDALPRKLEDADALLHGRFRFHGETVEIKDGSVFDKTPPSREWAEALHGFAWLPPLSAAGGDPARTLATNLITQWMKRNARYAEPASEAHVLARRLIAIFAHGRLVLTNSDMLWRSKVFVSLREQSRLLARIAGEAPDGLPRLEAAAAVALSGACLGDTKRLDAGVARLEAEIARQVLPDGGFVTRSPEDLVHAYRLVTMVSDALVAVTHAPSTELLSARDRMAPMLRFFRHGDGALALFNGGQECDARMIASLLARDEVRGQPFGHARHAGYQRLAAGRAVVVMDCGAPPMGAFAVEAHAGCLSFEMSSATHRLIVNCGAAVDARRATWDSALRATAAHSTVTLADTSMGAILGRGLARDLLGARLIGGPVAVDTQRIETPGGWMVEGGHDGYVAPFGVRHERQLTLAAQGAMLTGLDRLLPKAKERVRGPGIPFAIRFHIHPDVRMSPSQGGDVILKLPNGEGWRFRAGTTVAVEESVYLGGDMLRRSEQLVLAGTVADRPVEIAWVFEQIGRE